MWRWNCFRNKEMHRGIELERGFFFSWQESKNLGMQYCIWALFFNDSADFWYSLLRPESLVPVSNVEIFVVCLIRSKWLTNTGQSSTISFKLLLFKKKTPRKQNHWLAEGTNKQNRIRFKERKMGWYKKSHPFQSWVINFTKCSLLSWTSYKSFKYVGAKGPQNKIHWGSFCYWIKFVLPYTHQAKKLRHWDLQQREEKGIIHKTQASW